MNMKKCKYLLFCGTLALWMAGSFQQVYAATEPSSQAIQQQSNKVTGKVSDATGPIIGASVVEKGTANGTITDLDGNFSLNVKAGATLVVSYVGYKSEEVKAGRGPLSITLKEDAKALDEVVVTALGIKRERKALGYGIDEVKGEALTKAKETNLINSMAGRVPGLVVSQTAGGPSGSTRVILRGSTEMTGNNQPLYVVDGVPLDNTNFGSAGTNGGFDLGDGISSINADDVENMSVLKGPAASALYGSRASHGVILITTKRGAEGKAKVSFSTSAGVNVRTKDLEFANSYQYASYYNMMKVNDGGVATFSDEQLETFRNHSNPLMYPDINWIDYCMNKAAFQSQHNVNISGGTSNMKYFVSAGLFTQGGMFKQFNATDDFNFDYKRYNYRANLDFDVTKTTLLSVNIGGRIETKRTPESGEDQNQLFRKLYWAVPFAGAGIVNGERVVSNSEVLPFTGVDGLSSYYGKGFQTKTTNVLNVDLALNQKLDFITKGLSVKLKGAYNSEYANTKKASSSKAYYTPVANADGSISLRKYGTDSQLSYGEPDNGFSKARNWYMELALNYARKFGDHNVTALLLYNQSKKYYPSEYSDIPTGYVGLVGRVTYDWKTRYMAEFNAGYNGSENFRPGNRYGFFPAGSLGWVVSEESFFQPIKSVVNYLKLRASVGMVGNDVSQRFLYLPDSYQYGDGGYYFGQNVGNKMPGASEVSRSNPDAKWETAVKQNYGVDATFLAERLTVSLDYFREDRSDILSKPDYLPAILGMSLPSVNVGETLNRGFEVQLKWNETLKNDFRYWANFNISFSRNKIVYKNEVDQNEPWMYETGRRIGSRSMYKFWGFYDETADMRYQEEFGRPIANHGITLVPGDCVYVDLNADGEINSNDATRDIGYTDMPEYTAGLNTGFSWKNFDFSMQWTGAWNVDRMLDEFRRPLGDTNEKGLLLYQYDTTWRSSADTFTAKFPRTSSLHASNNYAGSDLYLINASYLRLKSVEIGYNFNFPFMKKLKMDNCRLYVNGYNLITITGFKWGDPESRQSSRPNYPLTRVFNIGLKLGF